MSVSSGHIVISTNTTYASGAINQKERSRMEHHIPREKLIEVVTQNKDDYLDLHGHARSMYEDELAKKTQEHLDGKIATGRIMVLDQNGQQICLPQNMEQTFDDKLQVLELDSRKTIVLDNTEYGHYVKSNDTNMRDLREVVERLEALS